MQKIYEMACRVDVAPLQWATRTPLSEIARTCSGKAGIERLTLRAALKIVGFILRIRHPPILHPFTILAPWDSDALGRRLFRQLNDPNSISRFLWLNKDLFLTSNCCYDIFVIINI